ncbi:M20/M25/M40 family metallo-hydrolase [Aminipila butyrica]|uniref:M20/M25/M40 family metallo-hydrolase n=1 Tax=Aminipila butyrica TaxID=433296 RepID=A0A858BU34_9FIRM|nr:M20/M25/M40 family metallo-hydrolase [Aminipila butyrica]QIB69077.1 M20/M25/M40 family metallo-hydrolase [Aminipila butyrica]
MNKSFSEKLMETMLDIVSAPSITGTPEENLAADKIYAILATIPYFIKNPQNLKKIQVEDDPLGRTYITAMYRSPINTNQTLLLAGHHDVVDIEPYGHLKDLAFSPTELTKRISELSLSEEALRDLNSGEWLFGRGVNDMKYGLALAIELLRELSEKDDLAGNLLFLSVPAEEYNSEGMLSAVEELVTLQQEGCEYISLLLLEPSSLGSAEEPKTFHMGAIGKLNPLFFFVGKETHVSESLNGINVNSLASELNRLLDQNLDLCEEFDGEFTVPPTCLKQTDLKELYNVTTPLYAASYYSMETLNVKTEDLMRKLRELALEAFEKVLSDYSARCKKFQQVQKRTIKPIEASPFVITYSELYQEVKKNYGDEFDRHLDSKVTEWKEAGCDKQTIAIYIVRETCAWYPNKIPMIVIGFAPPYYPNRYPELERPDYKALYRNVAAMIRQAREQFQLELQKNNFCGVSDFSYFELGDKAGIQEISSNLLGMGKTYQFPAKSLEKLSIPGIVFGPLGRDPHKATERLHIPYAFEILPVLVRDFIYRTFQPEQ